MKPQKHCPFFSAGYCKNLSSCPNYHEPHTCSEFPCLNDKCKIRHPYICRQFSKRGKCKRGDNCAYRHFNPIFSVLSEIKELKDIIYDMKTSFEKTKREVPHLENPPGFLCPSFDCNFKAKSQKGLKKHQKKEKEEQKKIDVKKPTTSVTESKNSENNFPMQYILWQPRILL